MKEVKRIMHIAICFLVMITSLTMTPMTNVHAISSKTNLALHKGATASYSYSGMGPELAVDGEDNTRWATEPQGSNQWLLIDLGAESVFDEFYVASETNEDQMIGKFKIEGSNDQADFDILYESEDKATDGGYPFDQYIKLDHAMSYRYVKITIEKLIEDAYESISLREFGILAPEDDATPANINLALNKAVQASAAYSSMPSSNLTDDDPESRWSSEKAPTQWAYVDLGQEYSMNKFKMIWEKDSVYASAYNIYVSNDTADWGEPVIAKTDSEGKLSTDMLKTPVKGRYVKLEVTKMFGYPSVSCSDFEIMLSDETQQDPYENIALGKQTVVNSNETSALSGDKAVDGDTSSKTSRWAATAKPSWMYVDLGTAMNVNVVKLFWERRNTNNYEIQIANQLSDPMSEDDWTTVKTFDSYVTNKDQKIILDQTYKARYVRLKINNYDETDQDNTISWNSVSIYEIEIYGGNPKASISDVVNAIQLDAPEKGDKKLDISNLPVYDDFDITYNGTDYEQVIDEDLTIYEPIVDTTVKVSFKVTDKETKAYKFKEIAIVVPGTYTKDTQDNAVPVVLPELSEWKGETGDFQVTSEARIVIANENLKEMAETFAADYKELSGDDIAVVTGTPAAGDIFFKLTTDKTKGLKDEGYLMNVGDNVSVEAETETGAYWATRTILQILKANDFKSIPRGLTRDYPLYKVRGYIMDVARKSFTLDFIDQIAKELSWYKLNDFQVHLNDNYIFLEEYTSMGLDPMQAYSGFRLESDIKKGGNNGLNQQDLTSKDLFYTKDEFRSYIKNSRVRGVNIVPEIDTPAHSLALTKVRPDLRVGTNGRDNDHLNLTTKYDDSTNFVKSIFNEYLEGDNPVFDDQTIVHIGADEYNASSSAYRKFSNDMLKFIQDTGRTPRIWGSLSAANVGEEVRGEGAQINLWNFGYANMDKMYDLGFDLINCNDGDYYIVPNAGYYGNYLNHNTMYNKDINTINGVTIPAGDKQMVGGAFAVWNDMIDRKNNGVSEYDVYDRIRSGLPLFGAKLWGKGDQTLEQATATASKMGNAPGTNFHYDVDTLSDNIAQYTMESMKDTSGNAYDLKDGVNAEITSNDHKQALQLNGKESYLSTELNTVGLQNDLRVKVKRTSNSSEEQVLFESSYGSIKAVQKDTGKVGFSREMFDYSFNYTLPVNEWVELEFKNELNKAYLYVNGVLIDTLGDGEQILGRPLLATMMLPMQRIGSKSNAFIGYVDDIRLAKTADYHSTMDLDYAVWTANAIMEADPTTTDSLKGYVDEAAALINDYHPAIDDITALTANLNDAIANIDYDKADYSRLETYKTIILKDLNVFTTETAQAVTFVLDNIREDLPKSLQNTVDGYEASLVTALNNLVVKDNKDLYYVDSDEITATASSYQHDGSNPSNVLDGNPSTMWHTDWNNTTMPHWINLEFTTPMEVNALSYLPRQTGTNGNITQYKIQVSDDGINYTDIATGTWSSNGSEKIAEFDTITTTHIRLVAVAAVGNFASASEIKIMLAEVPADVAGLQSLIDIAVDIDNAGFTAASWNALQEEIMKAQELLKEQDPDANDVHIMKGTLSDKIMSLRLDTATEIDKTALNEAIIAAEQLIQEADKYTSAYMNQLKAAHEEAKAIAAAPNATQAEVDAATDKLNELVNNPILREDTTMVKAMLFSTISKAQSAIDSGQVETLAPSVKALFNRYLAAARDVYDNKDATNQDVLKAWQNLAEIMQYLDFQADKTALNKLITECELIDTEDYTQGVEEFNNALANAQQVSADEKALKKRIDEAYSRLFSAREGLKQDIVDKSVLKMFIDLANKAKEQADRYNPDSSWNEMLEALDQAQSVYDNKKATRAEVEAAAFKLAQAYENIRLLPNEKLLEQLRNYLEAVEGINKQDYTASAYNYMMETAAKARELLNSKDYTQAQADEMLNSIVKAYELMDSGKVEQPTVPSKPNVSGNGNTGSISRPSAKPDTSDASNTAGLLFMLAAAGFTAAYAKRKYVKK